MPIIYRCLQMPWASDWNIQQYHLLAHASDRSLQTSSLQNPSIPYTMKWRSPEPAHQMRKELTDIMLSPTMRPSTHHGIPRKKLYDTEGLALHQNGAPSGLPPAQAVHLKTAAS